MPSHLMYGFCGFSVIVKWVATTWGLFPLSLCFREKWSSSDLSGSKITSSVVPQANALFIELLTYDEFFSRLGEDFGIATSSAYQNDFSRLLSLNRGAMYNIKKRGKLETLEEVCNQ